MIKNIIITGIGGQGVVTAAGLLRWAILASGFHMTGLDNRGGAQRLGHVSAVIRFSDEPNRPMAPEIPFGSCDLLLSLEMSEGLRFAHTMGSHSTVFYAKRLVIPMNQRRAKAPYVSREQCRTAYHDLAKKAVEIDADRLAEEQFKQPILANLILLGAGLSEWPKLPLSNLILEHLSEDSAKAFSLGLSIGQDKNP